MTPNGINFWNMSRLPTTQHLNITTSSECLTQIIHQFSDAATLAEIFPKF
jgi:hypothetical protein